MPKYITIDGGTTNTRLSLVVDSSVLQTVKFSVGARNCVEGNSLLKSAIKQGIEELLKNNSLREGDIECIIASGMITSEFGLVNLPHIVAPISVVELHKTAYRTNFEDITTIPFVFIRGVKTVGADFSSVDMMRGEETELAGIFCGSGIYVLPGSHSKVISVDDNGRIVDFKTMFTGEMISALCDGTILKDAVVLDDYPMDFEYLKKGFLFSKSEGINAALFKTRVLKNLFGATDAQIYHFYMGIILCDEIGCILRQNPPKVIIGGKKNIKNLLSFLLTEYSNAEIICVPDNVVDVSSAIGAVKIYEY